MHRHFAWLLDRGHSPRARRSPDGGAAATMTARRSHGLNGQAFVVTVGGWLSGKGY
jgi:hypothetical protein